MFSRIYQDYMCVYKIVIQLIVIAIIMFCFNVIVTHCHYCHYPKVEFVKYFIRVRFHVFQYLFIIPQEHQHDRSPRLSFHIYVDAVFNFKQSAYTNKFP